MLGAQERDDIAAQAAGVRHVEVSQATSEITATAMSCFERQRR
jgi:hypothetical protein